MKISNLQDEIKQLANKRNIIVAQLNGYSQYDQVKYLHDWLINTLKYDTTYKKIIFIMFMVLLKIKRLYVRDMQEPLNTY